MSNEKIHNLSLKVKNYKCFQNEAQGFERICPINIIIGKNNSGKSSLIDLIEGAVQKIGYFGQTLQMGQTNKEHTIKNSLLSTFFKHQYWLFPRINIGLTSTSRLT